MRGPENRIVKTMPPCGIAGSRWRAPTFAAARVRSSFAPISKQFVQLDCSRSVGICHGHGQAQAYARDSGARWNVSGNVERQYTPADFTYAILTGKEVRTKSIAEVARRRVVLVESVVLAGIDTNHCRSRRNRNDAAKCARKCYC